VMLLYEILKGILSPIAELFVTLSHTF